ncbi:hypothetical protein MPSEU_000497900 [Mayamaea pseudoterrestris]|nr:hypothetical protein MPSEU_000497900 [Mayamaea pseudoterrestris]
MAAYGAEMANNLPSLGRILPIVDTVDWVKKLCSTVGVDDIKLRIKGETSYEAMLSYVNDAQELCYAANVRLWINNTTKRVLVRALKFRVAPLESKLARMRRGKS